MEDAVDRVLVFFGMELLEIIPGLVSTEIPADLSFDQEGNKIICILYIIDIMCIIYMMYIVYRCVHI